MARKAHETRVELVTFGPLNKTRFPGLGYQRQGRDWRLIWIKEEANIGPIYPTKGALIDDIQRCAELYGFA